MFLEKVKKYFYIFVAYFIIIKILFVVLSTERKDLLCPDGPKTKDVSLCKEGNSRIYHSYKPKRGDSKAKLKSNVYNIQDELRQEVKWRRYVLLGIIIALFYNFFMYDRIIHPKDLLVFVFIFVVAHKMFDDFFFYHHYKFVNRVIKHNMIKM